MFFDRGKIGGIGAIKAAARALESYRAGTAAGFDVGRFSAVAERHRHRGPFVGQWVSERARVARGVYGQGPDGADGLLLAFMGHRVVAQRGLN